MLIVERWISGGYSWERVLVKCGKKTCTKCQDGPVHGPYWYKVIRRKDGRTVRKYIGKFMPFQEDMRGAKRVI